MQISIENENAIIKLPAQFTSQQKEEWLDTLESARKQSSSGNVVLDASSNTYVDSSGVGALVQALKKLKEDGKSLIIRDLGDEVLDLFRNTGLDKLFTLQNGEQTQEAAHDLFAQALDLKVNITHEPAGSAVILVLDGIMNNPQSALKFKEAALLALAKSNKLILDFENLTYFDSIATSEIMSIHRLLKTSRGELRICCANTLILDLLRTLGFEALVKTFETRKQALQGW